MFFCSFEVDVSPKAGNSLPIGKQLPPKDREMRCRTLDFVRKIALNFGEDLFFLRSLVFGRKIVLNFGEDLFFLRRSLVFGRKIVLNFGEDFFFWDHLLLDGITVWISLNPANNTSKFGSIPFTVESNFKKSPPPPPLANFRLRDWWYSTATKIWT